MKNIYLVLGVMICGIVFAAGKAKKSTTQEIHRIARYIQNPDGSWKVVHVQASGPAELSVRPGLDTEGLTVATLAAMDAHDKAAREQFKD